MVSPGLIINHRYSLQTEVGRGGMGTVFVAYDTVLQRKVAIKVLHMDGMNSQGSTNILREARIIASLNHPNIVSVFDAGEESGIPYLVMELVEGISIEKMIPFPLDKIPSFLGQICAALDYAHQSGIVHRDLKPGNILLDRAGNVRLMDFGLARSAVSHLSEELAISGTIFYMAPEQAMGKEVDARSDLYSLGVVLYELVTGGLPFTGDNPLSVITQHIYAPVVPPNLKNPAIPIALNELILCLLSKNPCERPASAAETLARLDRFRKEDEESARNVEDGSILDRIARGRMVARQRELGEFDKIWRRVKAGEGQVLQLCGEPGIGKTRFIQEITVRCEVNGGLVLTGENYQEGGVPYNSFAQIIRSFLEKLPQGFVFPSHVIAGLMNLVPELKQRFPEIQANSFLDPKSEQASLIENLFAWSSQLTTLMPLVLIIEDAHWADSGSLALFHHLARRSRRLPLLLILTFREVELDERLPLQALRLDLNRERIGQNLKLNRLDPGGVEAMLAALFHEDITPQFLAGIYTITEGNPFFIEEVCKALVESGEIYYEGGSWHRPGMDAIRIPQNLRLAIQARISKLTAPVQEALRLAAVIGREFEFDILLKTIGGDEDGLIEVIESAQSAQFIQELPGATGLRYRFSHALFQATLLEGLHTLRRRRLHRQVAEVIQSVHPEASETLAYHFSEGGDDRQAFIYLMKAGRKAAAVFANAEAVSLFLAASNLANLPEEKAVLLSELAESRHYLGQFSQAKENYLSAADIYLQQGDRNQAALAYRNAARAAWDLGEINDSLELAFLGLERVDGIEAGVGLASLLTEAGRESFFVGQKETGLSYVQRALSLAERENFPEVLCDSLINLGLLIDWGPESIAIIERAIRIAELNDFYPQLQRGLNNVSLEYEMITGEFDKCQECARKGIEAARKRNDHPQELAFLVKMLDLLIETGKYDEVRERIKQVQQLLEFQPPDSYFLLSYQVTEAQFFHYIGEVDRARQNLETIKEIAMQRQDVQLIIGVNFHLSEIYFQLHEYELLKQAACQGIEYGKRFSAVFEPTFICLLATVYCREGNLEQASTILKGLSIQPDQALAPHLLEIPLRLARAELALACLEWDAAWEGFAFVVDQFHRLHFLHREARALADWAVGLQRRGLPEDLRQAEALLKLT